MNKSVTTDFRPMTRGHNFVVQSDGGNAKALVILPPFADEMNKSRHIISQFMRQATALGYSCILMDHFGTGDSEGDLSEASLALWQADLTLLVEQLAADGYRQLSFLAIRFGAIQLLDLLNQSNLALPVKHVMFWHPIFELKKFWQQFFRVKIAEQMALGEKLSQKELEQQLVDGEVIEIAGYPISPTFYASTYEGDFTLPGGLTGINPLISWFEVSQMTTPGANVQKYLSQLQQSCPVNFKMVAEAPFWNTTELASADTLLNASVQQLVQQDV
ncbi:MULTISPECIES: glycosyl transferase [unclassified Arsukibacterium]|uniref:glycosyl transferase n=1 Tax=unclassified Arsukibacterium TaxID=2635278 RepID=UPI000C94B16C|nr:MULTISPECIES: glycosyl transferase [unclassified Arsukibacterium]MAA95163.1 glycosyl transferase [Rheinheimera sp.]HAW91675.1 glycosyl transferase [Candidatus Azambacteria bacterium]|tara:strand:- start:26486 stop:27307 length:822 start_codon:yes stop_codon:yes gene_type:complete